MLFLLESFISFYVIMWLMCDTESHHVTACDSDMFYHAKP